MPIVRLPLILVLAALLASGTPADAVPDPPPLGGGHRPVPGEVIRDFDPPDVIWGAGHRGVDLAAAPGDAVVAALGGIVSYVGVINGVGWITIDHGPRLDTTYGDVVATVAAGHSVDVGEVIGHVADERGHLDWGARLDGGYIDPQRLLVRWELHLDRPRRVASGRWEDVP